MLCNGYERPSNAQQGSEKAVVGFYGVNRVETKTNASVMQGPAWQALLKLLGKDGDQVMLDLIFHCGVFVPVSVGRNNLYQLSGI